MEQFICDAMKNKVEYVQTEKKNKIVLWIRVFLLILYYALLFL